MHSIVRATAFAALALLASPAVRAQFTVGLDAVHDFSADPSDTDNLAHGSRYQELRTEIDTLGFTRVSLSSFDAAALASAFPNPAQSILILANPRPIETDEDDFSAAEIAAIQQFIDDQGRLLVLADTGFGTEVAGLNALLLPYGIRISPSPTFQSSSVTLNFSNLVIHELTRGPFAFSVLGYRTLEALVPCTNPGTPPNFSDRQPAGCTLEVLAGTEPVDMVEFAASFGVDVLAMNSLIPDLGPNPPAPVRDLRKILVLGDGSLWKDNDGPNNGVPVTIDTNDNRLFLLKTLHWLADLDPIPRVASTTLPALSPGALALVALPLAFAASRILRRR
jgi:hypothetical protein